MTKPAIVLDIDETSLSNWPAYRANGWSRITGGPCDLERGPCGIRAWQATGASKALPATPPVWRSAPGAGRRRFFHHRPAADLREAAENLRREGYEIYGVVLQPPGVTFKSAVDFKAPERRKIAEQGYTIILSMGDQDRDLRGGYAERTVARSPTPSYPAD